MKTKNTTLILAILFSASLTCFATLNMHVGTWKLNEAKSKLAPGASRNTTVVYTESGDSIKATIDGKGSDGKPAHSEWTGKFDGQDYPVTGDPESDMRSYKRLNDRMLTFTEKKKGKVIATGRIVVAPDGKSRSVTTVSTDSSGAQSSSMAVYDRQ